MSELSNITPFITNKDGDVYCITNLPEEFVAVLFAWVSRSPKSFKELLAEALEKGQIELDGGEVQSFEPLTERARAFHEKWTVDYGHQSVAEHAVAHVGIERYSRLASAELELSNEFLSITEYSQRYQRPTRGAWHNPFPVGSLYTKFEAYLNHTFDVFEKLILGLIEHQTKGRLFPASHKEYQKMMAGAEKQAFEDARYALPLAMYSQLGMTANGRAWRDGIVALRSSEHAEIQALSRQIQTEVTKVLPTLVRHVGTSGFTSNWTSMATEQFAKSYRVSSAGPYAKVMECRPEGDALRVIGANLLVRYAGMSYDEALAHVSVDEVRHFIQKTLAHLSGHDVLPDEFKHINYRAELLISEANWHQLLRHNRRTNFVFSKPSPAFGVTIPPRIEEAGLSHLLVELSERSQAMYAALPDPEREYAVLNAHHRRVLMHFNLWEAYHLINLRTSEHAQWDIRQIFNSLYADLSSLQPTLFAYAKRRS